MRMVSHSRLGLDTPRRRDYTACGVITKHLRGRHWPQSFPLGSLGDRKKLAGVFPPAAKDSRRTHPRRFLCALACGILLTLPAAAFSQTQIPASQSSVPSSALDVPRTIERNAQDYAIGAQDLLNFSFLEAADLSRDVRVAPDGTVSLPYLAERVVLAGLTLNQAEELLKRKYQEAGILNQPNISITLKELVSKPVTVMGAVRNPGVFQLGATLSLMRVITQAGGFSSEAGTIVQVMHASATSQDQVIRVRIEDLRMGLLDANIPIFGGDMINVLPAGSVYVVGAVNKPGRHSLSTDSEQMTLLRLIALSEDIKRTAKLEAAVILRKDETGATKEIPVDLKKILQRKAPDIPVMANDVLFIPESMGKRAVARGGEAAMQVGIMALLRGIFLL
jgi:polysaccharide export outer membrane protein